MLSHLKRKCMHSACSKSSRHHSGLAESPKHPPTFFVILDLATNTPSPVSGVFMTHSLRTVVSGEDDEGDEPGGTDGLSSDPSAVTGTPAVHNIGSTERHPIAGVAGDVTFRTFPMFAFPGKMYSGGFRIKFPARKVSLTMSHVVSMMAHHCSCGIDAAARLRSAVVGAYRDVA
jgi:hypothetical protein